MSILSFEIIQIYALCGSFSSMTLTWPFGGLDGVGAGLPEAGSEDKVAGDEDTGDKVVGDEDAWNKVVGDELKVSKGAVSPAVDVANLGAWG